MICDYCKCRDCWYCEDNYRMENCPDFVLDWDTLPEKDKKKIIKKLKQKDNHD